MARLMGVPQPHDPGCRCPECRRWGDGSDVNAVRQRLYGPAADRTYADGAALGCPDCDAGEPHVCPFLHADRLPEPARTAILDHIRDALDVG